VRVASGLLSAEQILALRAALHPGDAGLAAFTEWRRRVDFTAIDAPTLRLVPLIYRNIATLVGTDPILGRMRGVYRRTWVMNELRLAECTRAVAALDAAGIPSVLLKGAAMIVRWIGDPGLRWMGDLDVLVKRAQARGAIALLAAEGWHPVGARAERFGELDLEEQHAAGFRSSSGQELDLHWRALRDGSADAGDQALWERAEGVRLGRWSTHVLAPEDHVYHACAHAATWTAAGRIDWAADAAIILRAVGARFDWNRVVALARGDRLEVPVGALVAFLRDALAIPVPESVTRDLRTRRLAIADRAEFALRRRRPHELGRLPAAFLTLQDYRRRTRDLIRRPLPVTLLPFARAHWQLDSPRTALSYLAFAALGRPRRLRRLLASGGRTLAARNLVKLTEGRVELHARADPRDSLVYGWSFPEADGRWTDGVEALLAVRIDSLRRADLPVQIRASPCLHPRHPVMNVEVWANDWLSANWTLRYEEAAPALNFNVPFRVLKGREVLSLVFVFRSPCRPIALGLSFDARRLGLFVREVEFGSG
jgi:hypothetical protein